MTSGPPTKTGQRRVCPECGAMMAITDDCCIRCALEEAKKPAVAPKPSVTAAAPVPSVTPASATEPVPVPPVRRPRPDAVSTRPRVLERPGEVSVVVVLLFFSAILHAYGAFTGNSLNMMPTMFLSPSQQGFGSTADASLSLGIILAIVNLAGKGFAGVALWRMAPWARKAAIGIIIGLFLIGTGVKAIVVRSILAETVAIQQRKEDEKAKLLQRAFVGAPADVLTRGTSVPSVEDAAVDGPGTLPPVEAPNTIDHGAPYAGENQLPPDNTAPPFEEDTESSTLPRAGEDEGLAATPSPVSSIADPNALLDYAEKAGSRDMWEEFKSGMVMGLAYVTILGLLITGILLYLLRMDHVADAFYEE